MRGYISTTRCRMNGRDLQVRTGIRRGKSWRQSGMNPSFNVRSEELLSVSGEKKEKK
jgi:hypothetical protein